MDVVPAIWLKYATMAPALLREPILSVGHAEFANHNGGQLQLGPDGHLYISVGDGGGGGDPGASPSTASAAT